MRYYKYIFFISLYLFIFAVFVNPAAAQKMTVEEIISKHLDSIGTKEKREEIKNRFSVGKSDFESKIPNRKTSGKALIVSEANNLFFVASFNSNEYPFEKIGLFKNKISLPFITSGNKSPLGIFISDHEKILTDGLLTGSISSVWTLLNTNAQKGKLAFDGGRKIDGRETYVLDYFPKNSSPEFTIKLFFDAQNFQHIRTEYRHTVSARESMAGIMGQQTGAKITLFETFSDFKEANGLILPHKYNIQYLSDSNRGTYEYIWGISISQYLFNQNLDSSFFSFDEK